jgi:lipopolysaccharide transport system permease protein
MLLSLGFGIMISALTTKYRDLKMLITFGLQLWLYASPVAYDMFSMQIFAPGGALHTLYMLNPVTPIINVFRYAFLGIGSIDWMFYGISWGVTVLVFFIGVVLFSRVEKTFMDTI